MVLLSLILWIAAEVVAALAVAHLVGVLACVLLLLAGWPAGAAVMRAQGRATVRMLREALASGRPPAGGTGETVLALLAGPLLIVPGFVTDLLAGLLLVPVVRRRLWAFAADRVRDRLRPGRRRGARRDFDVEGTAHETAPADRAGHRPQLHG